MQIMPKTLYVVSTPIGNLGDMTYRAIEVLSKVDFVAAEDTRVSLKLLTHFEIKKSLVSYNENNKIYRGNEILSRLQNGDNCALVTDAGTPAISDPGEDLVRLCIENGFDVVPIPGVSAAITALSVSGFDTSHFVFEGFLSVIKPKRYERLEFLKNESRTMIFYEAPHKIINTITDMQKYFGERRISVHRELTKLHEQKYTTTFGEFLEIMNQTPPRGEYVVIVEGCKTIDKPELFWENMSSEEHLQYYLAMGVKKMQAMRQVAKDRGIDKKSIL